MAKTDSTKVMWRVQVRRGVGLKWQNKGLYETRDAARYQAAYLREGRWREGEVMPETGYGFRNTRVLKYIRGEKK